MSLKVIPVLALLYNYLETGKLVEYDGNPFIDALIEDIKLSLGLVDTGGSQFKWFGFGHKQGVKMSVLVEGFYGL